MIGLIEWLLMFNFVRGNWISHTCSWEFEILEEMRKMIYEICKKIYEICKRYMKRGKLWWNKMKRDEISKKKTEKSSSKVRKKRKVRKTRQELKARGTEKEKECETDTKREQKCEKQSILDWILELFPKCIDTESTRSRTLSATFTFPLLILFFFTHLKKSNALDISILITWIN